MADNLLRCSMCPYATVNDRVLLNHYVRTHRFDDRFYVMCTVDNCGATYKRWKSYKMHVFRKHRDVNAALEENGGNQYEMGEDENMDEEMPLNEAHDAEANPWENAQLEATKFVLNIRDSCKTSDVSRVKVMDGTLQLMQSYMSLFMNQVRQQADPNTGMVSTDAIDAVCNESLPIGKLFSEVDSKSKLDNFLKEQFQMIMPEEVEMGRAMRWRKKPTVDLVEVVCKGYCIPFLESLKRLLSNDQVRYCVENPRHSGNILKTVLDGTYYKSHPFFSTNIHSLGIILYYDEIEIVNPLGSHTHKLGMFYWTLANIYPELRSSFNAINPFAIAKYSDSKTFGIEKILHNFVQGINELQTNGVSIMVNGVPKIFKGSLLMVTGDTPASALLGGFKQSVSASKPCRRCITTQAQLRTLFSEGQFTLRKMETHLDHVEAVSTPGIQVGVRIFWRQVYGINGTSPLLNIAGFDITQCMVQDIMHVLSEGLLEVETRVFLKWCVDNGIFTVADFNEKIELFNFGPISKNTPSNILPVHLNNNLRQSAAQMVCLAYVVPFIVQDLAQDNLEEGTETYTRLACHNLLLQIINVCLAFEATNEDAHNLQFLIEVFLRNFKSLYADAIVPKFHFLVHVPNQIIQFGPLRQQCCMRFEAVLHAWFKSLARVIRSVKNIPWSLSYRYESLRCVQLNPAPGTPSTRFLYVGDAISEGFRINLLQLQQPDQDLLRPLLAAFQANECILMCTPKVIVHSTKYMQGSLVLLSCLEENMPVFGKVSSMYVHNGIGIVYVIILPYETVDFSETLNAYCIRDLAGAERCAYRLKDLLYPHELSFFFILRGKNM